MTTTRLTTISRLAFALPFGLAMLFCVFAALLPTDTENTRRSLENQRAMHFDMIRMGEWTEAYRTARGGMPTTEQLREWMTTQEFSYRWFDEYKNDPSPTRLSLGISRRNEDFILGEDSELPENSKHTYRISYWNNWTEEYAPETGAHTFATSLDDYAPAIWQRLVMLCLALVFGVLGYLIGIRQFTKSLIRA